MNAFDQPHQWILIRGLAREQRHWGEFPNRLKARFPKARVLMLDHAGVGTRSDVPAPTSIPEMAKDLRDQFARTTDGSPAFILSPSLGAMVSMEWLKQDSSGLLGAVLINTSLKGFSPFWDRMQPGALFRLFLSVLARSPEAKERWVLSAVTSLEASRDQVLPLWTKLRVESPIPTLVPIRQMFAAMTHAVELPKNPPPILLMRGMRDNLAHPRCSLALSKHLPTSQLVDHPTAGHDLPVDDPEWIFDQVHLWKGGKA